MCFDGRNELRRLPQTVLILCRLFSRQCQRVKHEVDNYDGIIVHLAALSGIKINSLID